MGLTKNLIIMLNTLKNCHLDIHFDCKNVLGQGTYGKVYKGEIHATNKAYGNVKSGEKLDLKQQVAVKRFKKETLRSSRDQEYTLQMILNETNVLKLLSKYRHENITKLYHFCEDLSSIYLSMEYCNASDLRVFLKKRKQVALSEECTLKIILQLSKAMTILNKCGIMHRDIKPSNIMLHRVDLQKKISDLKKDSEKKVKFTIGEQIVESMSVSVNDILSGRAIIKLADFGLSKLIPKADNNEKINSIAGSPMYMAPEVITKSHYSANADLWSIGVLIYQLLTRHVPFTASSPTELSLRYSHYMDLQKKGKSIQPSFPSRDAIQKRFPENLILIDEDVSKIGVLSNEVQNFLIQLLEIDSRKRISVVEFINHDYLVKACRGRMHRMNENVELNSNPGSCGESLVSESDLSIAEDRQIVRV